MERYDRLTKTLIGFTITIESDKNLDELPDDTKIFRVYNFHDLINTLSTNQIRLSQVARMEDQNELFGKYFDLIRSIFGPQKIEDIDETQRSFREAQNHHYMTCWTRVPDNIAVWSLYSPTKDAIQVGTTFGKLRKAVRNFAKTNSYANAFKLEPNNPQNLFRVPDIGPVQYVDFQAEYELLKNQCQEYFSQRERWIDHRMNHSELIDMVMDLEEHDDNLRAAAFKEPHIGGPLLKDFRYEHELEVRFVLNLCRRDGRTEEEHKAHPMAGLDDPAKSPEPEDCPPNVFVDFDVGDFFGAEVDGRIEDWKFEAIASTLSNYGLEVKRNQSFAQFSV